MKNVKSLIVQVILCRKCTYESGNLTSPLRQVRAIVYFRYIKFKTKQKSKFQYNSRLRFRKNNICFLAGWIVCSGTYAKAIQSLAKTLFWDLCQIKKKYGGSGFGNGSGIPICFPTGSCPRNHLSQGICPKRQNSQTVRYPKTKVG